jgi:hypothetical protein
MDKVPSCDRPVCVAQLLSCFQLVADSRSGNVANPSRLKVGSWQRSGFYFSVTYFSSSKAHLIMSEKGSDSENRKVQKSDW